MPRLSPVCSNLSYICPTLSPRLMYILPRLFEVYLKLFRGYFEVIPRLSPDYLKIILRSPHVYPTFVPVVSQLVLCLLLHPTGSQHTPLHHQAPQPIRATIASHLPCTVTPAPLPVYSTVDPAPQGCPMRLPSKVRQREAREGEEAFARKHHDGCNGK